MIRFLKDKAGTATIEFVILFPIFMTLLLSSIEAGIFMTRYVMLDRGMNMAVRDLRLGKTENPTFAEFKDLLCSNTLLYSDCVNHVKVELQPVDMATWAGLGDAPQCRDIENEIDPFDQSEMSVGENNELMMVRVCGLYDPFFATTQFGLGLTDMGNGKYALIAQSAFVNEPSK